jgi:hypothetical protein
MLPADMAIRAVDAALKSPALRLSLEIAFANAHFQRAKPGTAR